MVFVLIPIDVVWLVGEEVERVERLNPWSGFAIARADTIIEFPSGTATAVKPGDRMRLLES